jgi:hypothetical protein
MRLSFPCEKGGPHKKKRRDMKLLASFKKKISLTQNLAVIVFLRIIVGLS